MRLTLLHLGSDGCGTLCSRDSQLGINDDYGNPPMRDIVLLLGGLSTTWRKNELRQRNGSIPLLHIYRRQSKATSVSKTGSVEWNGMGRVRTW